MLGTQTDNQSVNGAQYSNTSQTYFGFDYFYLTGDQYTKFLSLINEKHGAVEVSANMAGICCNFFC